MSRTIVNVATDSWVRGQRRLMDKCEEFGEPIRRWTDIFPPKCPPHWMRGFLAGKTEHECRPYAFKAYALEEARCQGIGTLLWLDASVVPLKPLTPIWERIERNGYWILQNGWTNDQWTAEDAYQDLFPGLPLEWAIEQNRHFAHVVGTVFGLDTTKPLGSVFLSEYFRLASETRAFCGPWQNSNAPSVAKRNQDRRAGPCGPPTVLGHRHDQTAMSVIAHNLHMTLDADSGWFAYEGGETENTILVAKGIL